MSNLKFLIGQNISAFTENNEIIEGVIAVKNGKKIVLSNQGNFYLENLKSIKQIGKHLDEDINDSIVGLSNKIDWEKLSKDPNKDKLIKTFADTVAQTTDSSNKDEVTKAATEEANSQIMQLAVKNGTNTATNELEKYMKDKEDKVEEAENKIRTNMLKETEVDKKPLDYGENNVYPANIPENDRQENGVIDNSTSETTASTTDTLDDASLEASVDDDINNEINNTNTNIQPMTTDMEVAQKVPTGKQVETEPVTDDTDDTDYSYDDYSAENNITQDDKENTNDEEVESPLENVEAKLVSDYKVDPSEATNLVSSIKTDIANATAHAVKDTLASIDKTDKESEVEQKPSDDSEIDDNKNEQNSTQTVDAVSDTENDEVDDEVEHAIDAYTADDGNYSDEGMYESLCQTFDITDGDKLLRETNGSIPMAVLKLAEEIKINRHLK